MAVHYTLHELWSGVSSTTIRRERESERENVHI